MKAKMNSVIYQKFDSPSNREILTSKFCDSFPYLKMQINDLFKGAFPNYHKLSFSICLNVII